MNDAILFAVDEGLARLTLNRPARLNAFNADLAHAWRDATAEATSRSDVTAILIDAAGPAFCAGGDVIDMATTMGSADDITALAEVINTGIRSLTESAVPVVAAAHGTTAGGGLGILLSSDYAVVGSRSRLGSLYANIGLTPDSRSRPSSLEPSDSVERCSWCCRTACCRPPRRWSGASSQRPSRGPTPRTKPISSEPVPRRSHASGLPGRRRPTDTRSDSSARSPSGRSQSS